MKAGKEKRFMAKITQEEKISRWEKREKSKAEAKMIQINGGKLNIGKNL